jgi:hypothetical protein
MNDEQNGNKPHAISEDSVSDYLSVEITEDLRLAEQIIWDLRQNGTSLEDFKNEVQRAITMLHVATGKKLLQEK